MSQAPKVKLPEEVYISLPKHTVTLCIGEMLSVEGAARLGKRSPDWCVRLEPVPDSANMEVTVFVPSDVMVAVFAVDELHVGPGVKVVRPLI